MAVLLPGYVDREPGATPSRKEGSEASEEDEKTGVARGPREGRGSLSADSFPISESQARISGAWSQSFCFLFLLKPVKVSFCSL